jgi:hypothetical protein
MAIEGLLLCWSTCEIEIAGVFAVDSSSFAALLLITGSRICWCWFVLVLLLDVFVLVFLFFLWMLLLLLRPSTTLRKLTKRSMPVPKLLNAAKVTLLIPCSNFDYRT